MKVEGGSVVTNKLSKLKDKVMRNKKPGGPNNNNNLADTTLAVADLEKSVKFSSNGSLLSQNGVKATFSEQDVCVQQPQQKGKQHCSGNNPYLVVCNLQC